MSDAEPVLDVPAISYTEVEQQQRDRAEAAKAAPKAKRRSSKRQQATPRRKERSAPVEKPNVKRGEVGPAVVAAVEAKLNEGLNASQAFEAVAKERGMKAGAVSANYYRIKRNLAKAAKTSGTLKRPTPRKGASTVSSRAPQGVGKRPVASIGVSDIERVVADLIRGVEALSDAVKQQGSEVAELRSRLGQVGSVLGG